MDVSSPESPSAPERDRAFFGQPRPLAHLFGMDLWERFSFYGMQGILLIHLYCSAADGGLGISEAPASSTPRWWRL
jgi:POT family proton-dependent oligopeptide transporter